MRSFSVDRLRNLFQFTASIFHYITEGFLMNRTSSNRTVSRVLQDRGIMRYILGKIEEEDYWAACAQWRQAGGNDVIAEYTEQYLALHPAPGG